MDLQKGEKKQAGLSSHAADTKKSKLGFLHKEKLS